MCITIFSQKIVRLGQIEEICTPRVSSQISKAILVLQDGTYFEGNAIGKIGTTTGEICFNTGMTGYQEVFTDPSYFGQILVMTTDHIGNYGVHHGEIESDSIKIAGLVCKKFSHTFSRKLGNGTLDQYFTDNHLTGISDIDTRMLVAHIRETGAQNAIISSEILDVEALKIKLSEVPSMDGLDLAPSVSTPEFYEETATSDETLFKVALIDFGSKKNIARELKKRGCDLGIFPYNATAEEILKWNPDGFMISNGPGDPASMVYAIDTIKTVVETGLPTFGICLGHQLLSLASGLKTYKMHHGHRGCNHPVKNLITGRSEITSQNHGFAVEFNPALQEIVELTHINLNDDSVEGIRRKDKLAFSVQHHPEASPGPHDSLYLFDDFIQLMSQNKA
jgi:carbamoyl-phosphate synthase small subunit